MSKSSWSDSFPSLTSTLKAEGPGFDGDQGTFGKILRPDFEWGNDDAHFFGAVGIKSSLTGASSSSITISSIKID